MKKIFYFVVLLAALSGFGAQLLLMRLSEKRAAEASAAGMEIRQPANDGNGGGQKGLRNYATVPAFAFTDRSGSRVSLDDLKGKVWLASFVYTTCPDTCPMLSHRFQALQAKALASGNGDEVRLVSFSVDPDHDTPEVLAGYADALKASPHWYFLTGAKEQIERVARGGFLVGFEKVPGDSGEVSHSTKIALVDRKGVVRGYYDGIGDKDETPRILADLETLLKEDKP